LKSIQIITRNVYNPLDILKKGSEIKNSFKAEKEQLGAKLSRQESISSSDGMSDGSTKETH